VIGEALLAYAHLAAILSWVVFLSSATALARAEWFNSATLARLSTLHRIAQFAAAATLLTGLARTMWGVKGAGWYWQQPLLLAKLALLVAMVAMVFGVGRRLAQWRREFAAEARLPSALALAEVRRRLMWVSHLMVVPPLLGVLLARGIATI
jgi:putative membrane protein